MQQEKICGALHRIGSLIAHCSLRIALRTFRAFAIDDSAQERKLTVSYAARRISSAHTTTAHFFFIRV